MTAGDGCIESLYACGVADDEGGSRVDDTRQSRSDSFVAGLDAIEVDLPVRLIEKRSVICYRYQDWYPSKELDKGTNLLRYGIPIKVSLVLVWVRTAQKQLAVRVCEVKRELPLGDFLLVNKGVEERGRGKGRERRVAQAHKTIGGKPFELTESKAITDKMVVFFRVAPSE